MKICPRCAEEIQDAAVACRFCGAEFATLNRPVHGKSEGCFLQTMNYGCVAIVAVVIFILLIAFAGTCSGSS